MHLTKYEQETIVNWNREDAVATVYTFEKDLQRRLMDFSKRFPEGCRLKTSTKEGSMTFEIKKTCLSLRLSSPRSEESRLASSERAKRLRLHKLGKEARVYGKKADIPGTEG